MLRHLVQQVSEMSENAMQRVPVEMHNFHGSLTEAVTEFNVMLAESVCEDAAMGAFVNGLMIEAAVSQQDRLGVLQEGVLNTMWESVKKFFASIIAFIKGIINKIQVAIASRSNNVSQWEKIVLPKVDKKLTDSKAKDDFTYEGYEWKGLENISKLGDKNDVNAVKTSTEGFKKTVTTVKENLKTVANASTSTEAKDDDALKTVFGTYLTQAGLVECDKSDSVDQNKKSIDEKVMELYDKEKTVEDYLKTQIKDIRSESKIEISKFSRGPAPAAMITFIKGSKDALEKIANEYDKLKDQYDACLSIVSGIDASMDAPDKASQVAKQDFNSKLAYLKDVIELVKYKISKQQSCMNTVMNKKRSLIEEASKDFMVILGKFANSK